MPGLSRFSDEEIKRMNRLKFKQGKSYSFIIELINRERPSNRQCTSRGVRACLKRSSNAVKSKRVYKRKLGFSALALVDAEVSADREISARALQKCLQETLDVIVSTKVINRERRRIGWVQTSTGLAW